VVDHRWLVIIGTLLFVGISAFGAKKLTMSGDYRVFFKADDPLLKAFDSIQSTYSKNDNILIVLAPKDGRVFTQDSLAAVKQLTDQAWKLPYSSRVDSVTNYQYSVADGDTLTVSDLVKDPQNLSASDLDRIKNIATHDPLLVKRIVSAQGHVTGINVTVQLPDKAEKVKAVRNLVGQVQALKKSFEAAHPNIEVRLTGVVMLNSAFLEATRADMRNLVPIMLLVVVVMLTLTMRSWVATTLVMLSIGLSVVATMGLAGWAGVVLSAPVATAPLTILIMAIADGVHVLSHYGHGLDKGLERKEAMVHSIGSSLPAMLLTNLLSAIGYLTMNFSDVPPFITLGNVVTVGILIGLFVSVMLIPALAVMLPARIRSHESEKITIMERYQEIFLVHRNKFLIGSLALTAVMGIFVLRNDFNDSFAEYFDKTTEFRQATDFTLANLTGVYMIDYSLSAGGPEQVYSPAFLKKVDEFVNWYRQQPEVLHVNTITDIMKRLNKNMHGDDSAEYRLPEQRDLAAQYMLLYELSLPYGLDLTNEVSMDKSATRVTVTLKDVKSSQMLDLDDRASRWIKDHGDGVIKTSGGTGAGMLFARIGRDNSKSNLIQEIYQAIIVSLLIIMAIGSFKLGLVGLIPNLTPAIMAYGLWGLTVGEINMAVSLVAGISLGIVVDDTVHFLNQYLQARRQLKLDPEQAVRYAFDLAGIPMWISTFTLVAGFLVLATSHFAMNSDMGIMTAMTIGFAALTEACMLPGLLLLFDKPGQKV
jgi:predicted RND superfamily exporter protein